uniref:Type II secretion system F family protein n=1 Tax=candidate division WOR-3 bacterium TaxID=2052148 RepID=A0A7V3ZWC0_UNCW3
MEFIYIGLNQRGEKIKGYIDAEDEVVAIKILKEQGLTPLQVRKSSVFSIKPRYRVKRKELILFTMQLHSVLSSGVPITIGLESLRDEAVSKDLKKVIEEIRLALLQGSSLYEAFSRFRTVFPPYYLGALKVGEESGTLPKTLERIVNVMQREEEQKDKTIKALIYPAFAITTITVAAIFYLFYVLPRVIELVKGLGTTLPLITLMVIGIVGFLKRFLFLFVILIMALIIFLILLYQRKPARLVMERVLVEKLGLLSDILKKSFYAHFTTFLSLMLEAGVDMSTSLELLTFSTGNLYLIGLVERLRTLVTSGQRLGEAVRNLGFPPLFCSMVAIGEETGTLPRQLNSLSFYYESELTRTVERLQAILEPVLIIFIGVFAALIFVSVLLPIYQTIGSLR